MDQIIKLHCFDIEVTLTDGRKSVISKMDDELKITDEECEEEDYSCEDILWMEETYYSICSALEEFILACALKGVNIESESFIEAIKMTVDIKCEERSHMP